MSDSETKFKPTVRSEKEFKVQVPNTPEGREFLEKLKQLLSVDELPFTQSCPPTPQRKPQAEPAHAKSGSTTYALDIRLEQEGWPP